MDWEQLRLPPEQPDAWTYVLRDYIREAIRRGALKPGERLPPVRDLAQRLGVHFSTVARAYRLLAQEGWVHQRRGRGTFVARPQDQAWREEALQDLARRFVQQARWLGFSPEDIRAAFEAALSQAIPAGKAAGKHPLQKEDGP